MSAARTWYNRTNQNEETDLFEKPKHINEIVAIVKNSVYSKHSTKELQHVASTIETSLNLLKEFIKTYGNLRIDHLYYMEDAYALPPP